jgi:hypothetical protein
MINTVDLSIQLSIAKKTQNTGKVNILAFANHCKNTKQTNKQTNINALIVTRLGQEGAISGPRRAKF